MENSMTTGFHELAEAPTPRSFALRWRAARGLDGAAASFHPRRLSHERRARRRDRAQAQAGFRLSPSQPREDRREHELPRVDALHRPARLLLLDDQQLGLRAQRRETRRHRSSRARRIPARHPGRAHPAGESHLIVRLPPQRHGRVGHAAHVCLPRTRARARSLRVAQRLAHDVRLHALRRLPG